MFIEITKQLRGYTRRWALRYCHCSFAVHLFTLINDHISEKIILYIDGDAACLYLPGC